ncbi:MAG: FtsB family cell division protein [Propionibacteriaceae bacterium]
MARNPRRQARSGAGPGRTPRSRPVPRSSAPSASAQASTSKRGSARPRRTGVRITRRAVVVFVLLALVVLSWARSITTYFRMQHELADRQSAVAQKHASIDSLEDQLQRWQDPNYVRAQARNRLGWVVPGETGFVVLDANGRPINGSSTVASAQPKNTKHELVWWEKLADSVAAADTPAQQAPAGGPTATPTKK